MKTFSDIETISEVQSGKFSYNSLGTCHDIEIMPEPLRLWIKSISKSILFARIERQESDDPMYELWLLSGWAHCALDEEPLLKMHFMTG